jgi:hypothetical protein
MANFSNVYEVHTRNLWEIEMALYVSVQLVQLIKIVICMSVKYI